MNAERQSNKHTTGIAYQTESARWDAIQHRDPHADGTFVYAVVTTGIYCRPNCPSRQPNRDNVRFYASHIEAEHAGFRPCKRCSPHTANRPGLYHKAVVRACRLIEESETIPSLTDLAHEVGLSPSYLHRLFKRALGVTPKQYAAEQRMKRVRNALQKSPTVTEAIYEADFSSSSRFYTDATETLGMKPTTFQRGGPGVLIRYAIAPCSLGWALVAATQDGICAIDLADTPDTLPKNLQHQFPEAVLVPDDSTLQQWTQQVIAFLDEPVQGLDLPLDIRGTAFQRRVWMALQETPPGSTASYADIAARIGSPKAARAVGGACAANPIAVAIPCHRVVRSNGDLGSYRWGIERKRALLELENKKPG